MSTSTLTCSLLKNRRKIENQSEIPCNATFISLNLDNEITYSMHINQKMQMLKIVKRAKNYPDKFHYLSKEVRCEQH